MKNIELKSGAWIAAGEVVEVEDWAEGILAVSMTKSAGTALLFLDSTISVVQEDLKILVKEGVKELKYLLPPEKVNQVLKICQDLKVVATGKPCGAGEYSQVLVEGSGKIRLARAVAPKVVESNRRLRVLIVDDSETMRKILRKALTGLSGFEVVGEAGDPRLVGDLVKRLTPDVMTLDIHMPEMNGVQLLKSLPRATRPTAVVVSSLAMEEGNLVIEALSNGAVDYLKKPSLDELDRLGEELDAKLKAAYRASQLEKTSQVAFKPTSVASSIELDQTKLIAIGASTGGTEAIKSILQHFPANVPPIVITQHIPPYFSAAFASHLDQICKFEVREAVNGDELRPGLALVAPGGLQMSVVRRESGALAVSVRDAEPMSGHKPSVDYLFQSVAEVSGSRTLAVILTGMGKDGAIGLKKIRDRGGITLGQDEASCVVYGMPRVAFDMGAVQKQVSLANMPNEMLSQLQRKRQAS